MSQFNVIVYNIDYDNDGEKIDLPDCLYMAFAKRQDDEEMEAAISDEISDLTGFCHKGFKWRPNYLKNIVAQSSDDPLVDLMTLARAATQGQWHIQEGVEEAPEITAGEDQVIGHEGFWGDPDQDWANAAYIAAACPETILPLLKELAEYRAS